MLTILSTGLIVLGLLGGALQLADLLTSEAHKKALADLTWRFWYWLARQKLGLFIHFLWNRYVQISIYALISTYLLGVQILRPTRLHEIMTILAGHREPAFVWTGTLARPLASQFVILGGLSICIPLLYILVHRRVIRRIVSAVSVLEYFHMLSSRPALFVPCAFLYVAWGSVLATHTFPSRIPLIVLLLPFLLLTPLALEALVLFFVLYISILWLAIVYVLDAVTHFTEWLLRRLIEKKGGVLASTSAVLVGLGALLSKFVK